MIDRLGRIRLVSFQNWLDPLGREGFGFKVNLKIVKGLVLLQLLDDLVLRIFKNGRILSGQIDRGDGLILAISNGVAKLHHAFIRKAVVIQIDRFQCKVGFQTRRQRRQEIVSKLNTRNGHFLDVQVGLLYGVGKRQSPRIERYAQSMDRPQYVFRKW